MSDADLQAESLEARPCSAADLPRLRATWPSSADVLEHHFAQHLSGTQTLVVAWMHGQTGGEAVGSAVIRWQGPDLPEIRSAYPDVVEIAHVQVRPDVRGRGVGTCLMRTAEALARLRGVPWLGLGVGVDNPQAAALYERLGYVRTGIVTRSDYQYLDEHGVEQHAVEWDEYMIMDL